MAKTNIGYSTRKHRARNWRKLSFELSIWKQEHKDVIKQLEALGDDPDPDEIDRIVGNLSWTHDTCYVCHSLVDTIILFNWGSGQGYAICPDCLREAMLVLDEVKQRA